MTTLELLSTSTETLEIRKLVFRGPPGIRDTWQAGSHIRFSLTGGGDRAYSLLSLQGLAADELAVGVLLDKNGDGGSKFMHLLKPGDRVEVTAPANNFQLEICDNHSVLIAGGIGITPILSMALTLQSQGKSFEVHYAGRTQTALAFVQAMREICGDALNLHFDDDNSALDIDAILNGVTNGAHVYFCGPAGLIDAINHKGHKLGISNDHLHFELFKIEAANDENTPFEVEVHSTGQVVMVAANQTIVEALEAAGLDPLYDCLRGDCGICQCDVISGEPDHRDIILSDEEKKSNTVMQICVSRAKSNRLVLDI